MMWMDEDVARKNGKANWLCRLFYILCAIGVFGFFFYTTGKAWGWL